MTMRTGSIDSVAFVYDRRFLLHAPPSGHPERPDRLRRVIQHLEQTGLWSRLKHILPREATPAEILAVHTNEHFNFVKRVCEAGGGMLDEGDTHAVRESWTAAVLAAGAVNNAIDAVLTNNIRAAFCAVRPPGHHAERDRPMGFCLFNNVAVGARYAQHTHGVERVAILDWDVHHGNGTQQIFEDDPTVLYCSLHQHPFYPGTGAKSEIGVGAGEGFTLNIPLPAGTGEERYLDAFDVEIVPALKRFSPDLLIISAGFDAHKDDPIGGMLLTEHSFAKFTERVRDVAPLVSVLEGGYNLEALEKSIDAHVGRLSV